MKVKYYDLEKKRVFITGGGSGIGASIVEHFCEQGSEVYFIDINVSESEKLIEEIKNKKYSIPTFIQCDLLNIKQLQKTIADIIDQKGPIDILIKASKTFSEVGEDRHAPQSPGKRQNHAEPPRAPNTVEGK